MKTRCTISKMTLPTYPEPAYEKLPMYCENRCHQRTSGRVYPNAVVKAVVRDRKIDRDYTAIVLENEYLELTILPELGGRIFGARDKTNNYDFFYRQHVVKPALIGLLGSWISGGAEFNWPMHHRPSTFMPTDFHVQEAGDGSVIVWLSEHEPLDRMKGMVGIRLCRDRAAFETIVRLFNRTELPHSFLWWENIAVPVNEDYHIFFPQDVNHVHFHHRKSVIEYPLSREGMFNGRAYDVGTDLRRHGNTRDATSYFAAASQYDFFGGYDHGLGAGVVHVASHHISPGKKLFTWAYGQLGESWEKALTDTDGPYAELMAGVYSDNQPDFSWLEAGEVRQFSETWYPIKDLGEPLNANTRVAFNFSVESGEIRIYAAEDLTDVTVEVVAEGDCIHREKTDLPIGKTTVIEAEVLCGCDEDAVRVRLVDAAGAEIISFCRADLAPADVPEPRPVDPSPYTMDNPDDLYLAGLHVMQYRDPLVKPDVYWRRAVERNPLHYRAFIGLGLSALKSCRLDDAESHFARAVDILTRYNFNPRDGEAHYHLGLTQKYLGKTDDAYDAFYKSTWNFRWQAPGYYALATLDCARGDFETAKTHLQKALDACGEHQKARNLLAVVKRRLRESTVDLLAENLRRDPLDYWAWNETGEDFFDRMLSDPSQTLLDVVFDYTGAGLFEEAVDLMERFVTHAESVSPMIHYALAWVLEKIGREEDASTVYDEARSTCPDYCFPSRIEEMQVLQHVVATRREPRAAYYLGNLLYGREQYDAAIVQWEFAAAGGETYFVLYRNLAMAHYNNRQDDQAFDFMRKALDANPEDPQLIFEMSRLLQLTNAPLDDRLRLLGRNPTLVERRDDLFLDWVQAHNQAGDCEKALALLHAHTFSPCEGREHGVVDQFAFAHLSLGRRALRAGDMTTALAHFEGGQVLPENLGAGVWNKVMNVPCRYYAAGCLDSLGRSEDAREIYQSIVDVGIDVFTTLYLPSLDCYRALALIRLDRRRDAEELLRASIAEWEAKSAEKDYGYFATTTYFHSFHERPSRARKIHYSYLLGLAHAALGNADAARAHFGVVLNEDAGHLLSALELADLDG